MNHNAKNQYFTSYDVLFSHMTVTGSSLRQSTRCFASRLSPQLANYRANIGKLLATVVTLEFLGLESMGQLCYKSK